MSTWSTFLDILRGSTVGEGAYAPGPALEGRSIIGSGSMGGSFDYTGGTLRLTESDGRWDKHAAAMRCVLTTASNLAAIDLTVVTGDEPSLDHPVAMLWNQGPVGASMSARSVRQVMFARAELHGEAFAFLSDVMPGQTPSGIHPIYDPVEVLIDGKAGDPTPGTLVGFRVVRGGQKIPLLPDEVLWLRYPHPDRPWMALAPWKAALQAVRLDRYAQSWQESEMRNGARPSAVIYLGDLDERAYNQAKAEYVGGVSGPGNGGKSLMVAGPKEAKVERLGLTPVEMSYLESRVANAGEVMLAFGYRPDYFLGSATYENQRAAKVAVWSDVYLEKLDVLGSEVDRQLLPDPGQQAGFDVTDVDALRESQDAVSLRASRLTYADIPTVNEARGWVGLDPIADGDVTLTEWRARIKQAYPVNEGAVPPSRAAAGRLALTPSAGPMTRLRVRVRGVVRDYTIRAVSPGPVAPVVRAKTNPSKTLRAYDTHESIGVAVFAALARKQEKAVLRNLSKMRTSDLPALIAADHAEHVERLVPFTTADLARVALEAGTSVEAFDGNVGVVESRDGSFHVTTLTATDDCGCARVAADALFDASYWQVQTYEATEAWLTGAYRAGESSITDTFGLSFDEFDPDVIAAMNERRAVLAQTVTETTRKVLDSSILTVAAQEGWSIDDMEQAIRLTFADMESWRARTIARTETVAGYNHSAYITAQASGLVLGRAWMATMDDRTRPSHSRIDGEALGADDTTYSNGLRFPGDPYGSPRETVNCRCVETFEV